MKLRVHVQCLVSLFKTTFWNATLHFLTFPFYFLFVSLHFVFFVGTIPHLTVTPNYTDELPLGLGHNTFVGCSLAISN